MIELNGLYDMYKVRATKTGAGVHHTEKETTQQTAVHGDNQDVIEISPAAAMRAELGAAAKTQAAQFAQISPERMAYLKTKYAGDACPVSAEAVAGAILNALDGMA